MNKEFNDIFTHLSIKHSWDKVWIDFLRSCILGFGAQPEWQEEMKAKYSKEERLKLGELVIIWIREMDKQVTDDGQWFDFFGEFWETEILGNWERSKGGIFFTPVHLVDMMTMINGGDENTGKGLTVNDPTCGSGRMLISYHAKAPGNIMVAQDINYTCCLMTVCNFLIHGVTGEVIHMDTLAQKFYGAWRIDWNMFNAGGFPVIEISESETMQGQLTRALAVKKMFSTIQEPSGATETAPEQLNILKKDAEGQLTLF